ncbi:MAG TPA: hypothetical protein VIM98_15745 [Dyella sp.]|uniref:hypothetical protein n=1 Tax=Dyella sp. TaxID=1869338 RepID=UPI002F9527D6
MFGRKWAAWAVLLMVQGIGVACAADRSFDGDWIYKQACGQHHAAHFTLTQNGDEVAGDWSDGTQASGSDGKLKGDIHDGKLFVRYCGNDESAGYAVCPNYEDDETDYFVRDGADLVWYRMLGKKGDNRFKKYVVLHPSHGRAVPADNDCK